MIKFQFLGFLPLSHWRMREKFYLLPQANSLKHVSFCCLFFWFSITKRKSWGFPNLSSSFFSTTPPLRTMRECVHLFVSLVLHVRFHCTITKSDRLFVCSCCLFLYSYPFAVMKSVTTFPSEYFLFLVFSLPHNREWHAIIFASVFNFILCFYP